MSLNFSTRHPSFTAKYDDWVMLAHAYAGERMVKDQGTLYLPATSGMIEMGQGKSQENAIGEKAYTAYKTRATFPDFVTKAVMGMMGVMHRKPPMYHNIPKVLAPMINEATPFGESMSVLWRRLSESQLLFGRAGLLVEVPDGVPINEALPFIAMYGATTIINWDAGDSLQGRRRVELVVLDESAYERQADYQWVWRANYRVLALSGTVATLGETDQTRVDRGEYQVARVREGVNEPVFKTPNAGGGALSEIPFVFVNTKDVVPEPDVPPFLGLCNLCMSIYRQEADYKQNLFMQGQDTLVRIGHDPEKKDPPRLGAGAVLDVPSGADAKYVGVNSKGLPEQRQSLENDRKQASAETIQLLDTRKGLAESGDALRIRVAARTATLATIQLTAATALEDCLKHAGRLRGVSEDELSKIEVQPNLDFGDDFLEPRALGDLMDAKAKGLPLSMTSIHNFLREREYTTLSYEAEKTVIKGEEPLPTPKPPGEPAPPRDVEKPTEGANQ